MKVKDKNQLDIIKIGGGVIDKDSALNDALQRFSENKNRKILVHGGGKIASNLSKRLGVETIMSKGRRITSEQDLEIVTMVYAGLINKKIVAKLQSLNCYAIGLSGCDMGSILTKKRQHPEIDFGFVGDIESINTKNLDLLIDARFTPVLSAITHDGKGQLLNTNADTIASQLAIAFSSLYKVRLLYCFEKDGVLADPANESSVIPEFSFKYFQELKTAGFIHKGMIPKLKNCFEALEKGVNEVYIGNSAIINNKAQVFSKISL